MRTIRTRTIACAVAMTAIRYLFGNQHEHLGQSIAYAGSNGVVPPGSK